MEARLFKSSYSLPLPDGARIVTRKGVKFAKYQDKRGRPNEARLTKTGKILFEVKDWHIRFKDHLGIRHTIRGFTDRAATESLDSRVQSIISCRTNSRALDADLLTYIKNLPDEVRAELTATGLLEGLKMPTKSLQEYVADFADYMTRRERNPKHIREVSGNLTRIFDKCGFTRWADISKDTLSRYLDGRRMGGKGISKRRYNTLLRTVKLFCNWMVKEGWANISPVYYAEGLDHPQTDPRHARRVLSLDELGTFLDATLQGPDKYGLSGYERNLIYRVGIETGMRKSDFKRLRVGDCDFDGAKIRIEAGRTKNKTLSDVYLRKQTALELQQYTANKLPDVPVFHIPDKTEKMIQFDLANTAIRDDKGKEVVPAIPYIKNGEFFDFHSLRHQHASITALNQDISETTRMAMSRHKTPAMVRHYSHSDEQVIRRALEKMPDLRISSQKKRPTGTEKSC